MRKLILTVVLAIASAVSFAQLKDVMVIERNDNTTLRLSVDEIRRVLFESTYVNPAGALAEAVDLGLPSGVRWAKWFEMGNLQCGSINAYRLRKLFRMGGDIYEKFLYK